MSLFAGLKAHKTAKAKEPAPKPTPAATPATANPAAQERPAALPTVGDGGASWKAKALRRARMKAQESGESVASVVAERWEDMNELVKASSASSQHWRRPYHERKRDRDRRDSEERRPRKLGIGRDASDAQLIGRFKKKMREAVGAVADQELDRDSGRDSRRGPGPRDRESGRGRPREEDSDRGTQRLRSDANEHRRSDEPRTRESSNAHRRPAPHSERASANRPETLSNNKTQSPGGRSLPTTTDRPAPRPPRDLMSGLASYTRQKKSPGPKPNPAGGARPDLSASEQKLQDAPSLGPPPAPHAPAPLPSETSAPPAATGNQAAAAALRARLLGKSSAVAAPPTARLPAANVEVVAPFDASGRRLHALATADGPVDRAKEDLKRGRWKGKRKPAAGTEAMDVKDMVAQEREGGVDMDELFARNVVRLGGHYKGAEAGPNSRSGFDEEEDVDMKMFAKQEQRMTQQKLLDQQRQRAVNDHKKWLAMMQTNPFSMDNPSFKKHLVIAQGEHAYIMLRTSGALAERQCWIVPIKQAISTRGCSEEVWEEIQSFKSSLRRMYGAQGQGVLFLESVRRGPRHWARIEAVPVPADVEADAPLYFKQALSNSDEEWSIHNKVIDLAERGLRKAIPEDFPYFSVEWRSGGYAHIIEDEDQFSAQFGIDVLAGMLGVDPPSFDRHGPKTSESKQKNLVAMFQQEFSGFDFRGGGGV